MSAMSEFLRFLLAGCVNTGIGYGAILFFQYVVGFSYLAANGLGYVVGGLGSYVLNKSFSFASARPHGEAFPRFVLTAAACYGVNLVVLDIGISLWRLPQALAQALAISSYTASFYLLSKRLVFRDQPAGQ